MLHFITRCFRQWCHKKNSVNCTYCGNIENNTEFLYCDRCNEYGHNILQGFDKCKTFNIRQKLPRRNKN
jgi:hypothetical protein